MTRRRQKKRITLADLQRLEEVKEAYRFFGVAPISSHPDSVFFAEDGTPLFDLDEEDEDGKGHD